MLKCNLDEFHTLSIDIYNGGAVTFNLHLFTAMCNKYILKFFGIYVFAAFVIADERKYSQL